MAAKENRHNTVFSEVPDNKDLKLTQKLPLSCSTGKIYSIAIILLNASVAFMFFIGNSLRSQNSGGQLTALNKSTHFPQVLLEGYKFWLVITFTLLKCLLVTTHARSHDSSWRAEPMPNLGNYYQKLRSISLRKHLQHYILKPLFL